MVKLTKKNLFIIISLISIFFLVLFFNSYFNYTAGTAYNEDGTTLGTRFFLSGPDPYYNMRLCQIALETEHYPFVALTDGDPLLNYPVGTLAGARPPLFNLIAVASAQMITPLMNNQLDALGWMMLFLPAIYGALLILPVYGIGKEIFNYKVGLIAAFLVPLIPIHIGAGHGSAFSLFDHDSFILLLFTLTFYFIIKAYKEQNTKRAYLYALLGGVSIGAIHLTWAASQVIFLIVAMFCVVQLFIDIIKCKFEMKNIGIITTVLGTGFFIALPYSIVVQELPNFPLYVFGISIAIFVIYYVLKKLKVPWTISLPTIGGVFGVGLGILYFVNQGIISLGSPVFAISEVIYGKGIYGQKISLTIAEAHTFSLSQTVMSFGPAIYFLALIGFCLFVYKNYRNKFLPHQTFFIMLFVINFWLTTTAGRFLNDLLPYIAILSAYVIYIVIEKLNYKAMVRKIKSLSGFDKIKKGVRVIHVLGILFVVFLVVLPNTFLAMDAAVPPEKKEEVFGKGHQGAWGSSLFEQHLWSDALYWLSQQDTEIPLPQDRPGILTWWDYGFYIVSMGEHPAVADNYQEGFYPASNFLTSQSEDEAIAVLIIRLAEGTRKLVPFKEAKNISFAVEQVFREFFPPKGTLINNDTMHNITIATYPDDYPAEQIITWMNDPLKSPSYNILITPEYGNTILKTNQWNAMYHDITKIILTLPEDKIIDLYDAMADATGYQIRYFGLEYRDLESIFGVFPFLADKGTHGYTTMEDDFYKTAYVSDKGVEYNTTQLNNMTEIEVQKLNLTTKLIVKDGFYNSMSYRIFYGVKDEQRTLEKRYPTYMLKHFYPKYISPYITIAKFYEGANITGSVNVGGTPFSYSVVAVLDEYGLPHDITYVDGNGNFKLIAAEGNISVVILKDNNIVGMYKVGQTITEEQATRKEPCNISIPINVNTSTAQISISNVTEQGLKLKLFNTEYSIEKEFNNIENNFYGISGLLPITYTIQIINSTGGIIKEETRFLSPDFNLINITLGE